MEAPLLAFTELERAILAAPLRLSQPRWNSQDVANLVGTSQSAVARTWKKAYGLSSKFNIPTELEMLAVHYAQGHGLLLLRSFDDSTNPALQSSFGTWSSAMRAPRRIPIQTMLAGLLSSNTPVRETMTFNQRFIARAPFGQSSFAIGTSLRPTALPKHIYYLQVSSSQWQELLPHLIRKAHRTPAVNLQRMHQDIIVWAQNQTGNFMWVAETRQAAGMHRPISKFQPLRSSQQIISDQVFELIVDSIWDGHLTAGDRITESSLATRLHTTRNQTRDALRALASAGLVDHHPVRGVLVPAPDQSDISDIYAARRALGTEILRRAIENPLFNLAEVDVALQEVIKVGQTGNSYETGNADLHFQDVIAQESGMRNIPQMFNILAKQLRIYIAVMGMSYFYSIEDMVRDDTEIFRHLKTKDFNSAKNAWNNKISDSLAFMTSHVKKSR